MERAILNITWLRKKHDSIQKKLEEAEFAKEEAKRALDEALANGATADRITDSELAKIFYPVFLYGTKQTW